ncbi:Hypothetical predicted protein [Marmota monax]|uniref:Uncharacterized protein n=1 Tax=Marmota monax TaxID=9995 RepID=A0A5E4AA43_MARMO|nr:hypothetical protein GHT09_016053 [Marmota monax]VTJ53562.1 Hypothetical predicted protein [Marmota monax]
MEPSFDPDIHLLSLYPKYLKSAYYSDPATSVFIAAQFTIAKLWNQPRWPSTEEWIKKMWYIYPMEYYSGLKKNEMMAFAGKWMELDNIMLSKISQSQKTENQMFSLISRCLSIVEQGNREE